MVFNEKLYQPNTCYSVVGIRGSKLEDVSYNYHKNMVGSGECYLVSGEQ